MTDRANESTSVNAATTAPDRIWQEIPLGVLVITPVISVIQER